jgi:RimJ/RimL family protein N-acetyltransferase
VGDILEYSREADFWLARSLDWTLTADSIRAYFEGQRDQRIHEFPHWVNLMMELKGKRKVVGCVGIGVTNKEKRQASIGWMLGCRYQRQGLATEAARALVDLGFNSMGLHRIFARTGRANTRSWLLMERLGMRREAHFRQSDKVRDEWSDEFVYAILTHEWKRVQAGEGPC